MEDSGAARLNIHPRSSILHPRRTTPGNISASNSLIPGENYVLAPTPNSVMHLVACGAGAWLNFSTGTHLFL